MFGLKKLGGLAVVALLALFTSVAVQADQSADMQFTDYSKMTPSATMEFEAQSFKLILGAGWGKGTLHYEGKDYPLKVMAGTAGGIGYRSLKGTAKVYNLAKLEDFADIYTAGGVGGTAGKMGAGVMTLESGKKVVIQATVTDSEGLQLSVGLGGMEIEFDK